VLNVVNSFINSREELDKVNVKVEGGRRPSILRNKMDMKV